MSLQLLKEREAPEQIVDERSEDEDEALQGIRCPRCSWRPSASSRWTCLWLDTPEPYFDACGTVWNTFTTRGRCPGCSHQWVYTSCLRCDQWSLHNDWYERTPRPQ
jgi:hypothetical protein